MQLVISSTPQVSEGTIEYNVPVNGAVSMWFKDSVYIDSPESHYNWDVPVRSLIELAEASTLYSFFCAPGTSGTQTTRYQLFCGPTVYRISHFGNKLPPVLMLNCERRAFRN